MQTCINIYLCFQFQKVSRAESFSFFLILHMDSAYDNYPHEATHSMITCNALQNDLYDSKLKNKLCSVKKTQHNWFMISCPY